MKVTVIGGTGYVGLVSGIGLAAQGHDIICADINEKKIEELNSGRLPIYEKGLDELLDKASRDGKIRFTGCMKTAVTESEILIIAVGTPENRYGDTDLSQIVRAAKSIAFHMNGHKTVVIKSTVPVGTCELVARLLSDNIRNTANSFDIVSNPEFLREGEAVQDFMSPERIVIGVEGPAAAEVMKELYATFEAPVILTDTRTSEMTKYACNSYLASRISFINEIAEICEKTGADVNAVIGAMKLDKRIGGGYLSPGPGFGGPCLSKDIKSLINFGGRANANVEMLKAVLRRNELQIENIAEYFKSELKGKENRKIAVLGLSFKAGTDDTRNSPSIRLIEKLAGIAGEIAVFDPVVSRLEREIAANVTFADSVEDAVRGADFLALMTDWPHFRGLSADLIYELMRTPIVADARNMLDAQAAADRGIRYKGIGTGKIAGYGDSTGTKLEKII